MDLESSVSPFHILAEAYLKRTVNPRVIVFTSHVMSSISHSKQTAQVLWYHVEIDCLKNYDHHVLNLSCLKFKFIIMF